MINTHVQSYAITTKILDVIKIKLHGRSTVTTSIEKHVTKAVIYEADNL